MSLNSIILLIGSLIVFVMTWFASSYEMKKNNVYKNDERWLAVKSKTNEQLQHYHVFLLAITVIAMIVGTIIGGNEGLYVNFEMMIMVIFVILASRDLAKLFLLRKYDKTM